MGLFAPLEHKIDGEVWGCNRSYIQQCADPSKWSEGREPKFPKNPERPDLDRLFYFDDLTILEEHGHKDFVDHVNSLDIPIITKKLNPKIKRCEEYPIGDILKSLNMLPEDSDGSLQDILDRGFPYFTSTIAYMIAQAIYEGADKIIVHKMQVVAYSAEYYEQKACLNYWLGICIGKGIQMQTSEDSLIGKPHPWEAPLYGYMQQKNGNLCSEILGDVTKAIMRLPCEFTWSPDLAPDFEKTIPKP